MSIPFTLKEKCIPKDYNSITIVIEIPHENYEFHMKVLYKWLKRNIFDSVYFKTTYLGYFGVSLEVTGSLKEEMRCNVLILQRKLFSYLTKKKYILTQLDLI